MMADGFVLRKMPDLKGEILVFTREIMTFAGKIIVCRKIGIMRGKAEGKKLRCPGGRKAKRKKRENKGRAGQGRRKKAEVPRREEDKEKKERNQRSCGAREKEKGCGAPLGER